MLRRFEFLTTGLVLVALGLGACGSSNGDSVTNGETAGSLEVETSTTGEDIDSNGYTVSVDGSGSQSVGTNDTVVFSDLTAGDHQVELSGLAANCSAGGSNPRNVTVPENGTASTTFDISCESTGDPGSSESVQITGISFDASSHTRFSNSTDIFPTTWAGDGFLYTMGGDGDGWDGNDTRGLDVSRLDEIGPDGDPSQGTELSAKADVLPTGIISIDGTFYRGEVEREGGFDELRIGRSTDAGATWSYLVGATTGWTYQQHNWRNLSFVQMGQDFGTWWDESYGGEGDYVYAISEAPATIGGASSFSSTNVILMRIPRSADLRDPANHEYFSGTTGDNQATWTTTLSNASPIYREPNDDLHWAPRMTWNPVLNRFLLTHFDDGGAGVLTVLEGPTPWGPWTSIYDGPLPGALDDGVEKYALQFVNKRGGSGVTAWLSSDGKTWWAVFSGMGEWDSFNTIRATLTTVE